MRLIRQLGREGEEAAGIVRNSTRINSLSGSKAFRIPDALSKSCLKEVKNVAKLDFDAQLRDYLHYAIMTEREFVLVVPRSAKLSQPLQDAIRAGWITLEFLP